MAQHQLKQSGPASESLAQALQSANAKLPELESGDLGENWSDWVVVRILLLEVENMVRPPTAGPKE